MNLKINRFGIFAALTACAALLAGGCDNRDGFIDPKDAQQIPAVNPATLSPLSNESGSVKAYIGTEVTAEGFNLDRVGSITMDDLPAEMTGQTIKELKFKVPALDYAQNDLPYAVKLKVFDQQGRTIFDYDYFVTIPVTDALVSGYEPKEGCVGDEVTLTGRNLSQITRVHFGAQTVEAADFTEVNGDETAGWVKFLVPAGDYTAGDNAVAISAEWGTRTIDVTGDEPFTLHIPRFDALMPQTEPAKLGDELTLTGENLDRITSVVWGTDLLSIVSQSAEELTVRFPATIEEATPAVQTRALTARYGTPEQSVTLAADWQLDTTHSQDVLVPSAESMTAQDGGADNRFYLGKTVTVAGENLTAVQSIELRHVDGSEYRIAAAIAEGTSDAQLRFTVPDQVTFSEATQVSVVACYNGGDVAEFGTATVYPFYFYKGIRLGLGSNSKSTYTEYAAANAFFYPDLNRVVSTDAWYDEALDPYAKSGSNAAIASASKLDKAAITAEEYYAVKPYVFFITNSSSKLSLAGCANSASQIKTHCRFIDGEAASLPSTFGTPIMQYRVVTGAAADPIRNGTLTSMDYDGSMPSAGAPSLAKAETTSAWVTGSVLVVSYSNYARGDKPAAVTDFAKTGYIVIREITCADLETGLANADRAGYIEFDMYWSKMQNE